MGLQLKKARHYSTQRTTTKAKCVSDTSDSLKIDATKLSSEEQSIIRMLGFEPTYIDDIIRANDMKITDTIVGTKKIAIA